MSRRTNHRPEMHRNAPVKTFCRAATTANITIATALNNGDTLDGVTLATNDRVLVKDQSTGAQNGIYVVGTTPARAYDADNGAEFVGTLVYVTEGTANGGKFFKCTNTGVVTLDTTAITYSEVTTGTSDHGGLAGLADDDHSSYVLVYGGGEETVSAHGATGSTETINPAAGNWHTLTLDANCTLTLTAPTSGVGVSLLLEVAQNSTGGWSLILPASVSNKAEVEAAQDVTASKTTFLSLVTRNGGTTWYGFWAGNGGSGTGTGDAVGPILISSTHSTPLVFDDLLQNSAGDDLLYTDV